MWQNLHANMEGFRRDSHIFALCDKELGETDIFTQSIDTGTSPPVK